MSVGPVSVYREKVKLRGQGLTHGQAARAQQSWASRPDILDHLICLLRNLYACQEPTVRNGRETTDWFQIGKGVHEGCILLPCLFNIYAEHMMRNAGLDEAQAGIKIARRSINNIRYAGDTTLRAEGEEELKSLVKR